MAASRRKPALTTWLDASPVPVYVVDSRRRIVFFNHGCEQFTGWQRESLLGRVCEYTGHSDHTQVESITAALCPPAYVFSGTSTSTPVHITDQGGEARARMLHFVPLPGDDSSIERVFAFMTPMEQPLRLSEPTVAQQVHAELAAARAELRTRYRAESLICQSAAMQRVAQQVAVAGQTMASVCVIGESGTGREHVARIIHGQASTGSRAFVPLDCAATSAFDLKQALRRLRTDMEEAEKPGHLQPGTLYFSSVHAMPRDVQQRLLELLDGIESSALPPIRLMSSTTERLKHLVDEDVLDVQLYFRLTELELELPPLRERLDDLELLSQYFLEESNRGSDTQVDGFAESVLDQFRRYNWPGNVRELRQVVVEARAGSDGHLIQDEHIPFRFRTGMDAQTVGPARSAELEPLEQLLERVEREQLQLALEQAKGNRSQAASLVGMTRAKFYRRLKALGLDDSTE